MSVPVPSTPTNPDDLLRQVAEHAPKVLPERIVKPLLSALTFLSKDGHDSNHHWLAGRLARGVLALPEPSAVPATQDDLREQLAEVLQEQLEGDWGTDNTVAFMAYFGERAATAALTVVAPVLEGLHAEIEALNSSAWGIAGEANTLSSLLRGMARRVGRARRELDSRGLSPADAEDAIAPIVSQLVDTQYDIARQLHQQIETRMHETREMDKLRTALGVLLGFEEGRTLPGNADLVSQLADRIGRPSVSDQTPDDGDPFEIRSHAYRRANVCYECGQNPAAHASGQTPATPDEPRRNALVSVDMGALIRAERAPSSVQGDTTPEEA